MNFSILHNLYCTNIFWGTTCLEKLQCWQNGWSYKTDFMVLSTHSMSNMSFFLNIFVDHIFSKISFLICHVAFEYKLCGSDLSFMFFSNKYCLKQIWFTFSQRLLNYLAFWSFDKERTWWRLFQKHVIYITITSTGGLLISNDIIRPVVSA